MYLSPEFKNHEEAAAWLRSHGADLELVDFDGETYFYNGINNREKYKEHMQRVWKATEPIPVDMESLDSYNRVEISVDGHIHIIY